MLKESQKHNLITHKSLLIETALFGRLIAGYLGEKDVLRVREESVLWRFHMSLLSRGMTAEHASANESLTLMNRFSQNGF